MSLPDSRFTPSLLSLPQGERRTAHVGERKLWERGMKTLMALIIVVLLGVLGWSLCNLYTLRVENTTLQAQLIEAGKLVGSLSEQLKDPNRIVITGIYTLPPVQPPYTVAGGVIGSITLGLKVR